MLKVLELYSGIGGMHYALKESGINGQIIASIDINTNANTVYRHNFPETPNLNRNIQNLSLKQLEKLEVNAIFMSPPCQPFTRVGLKKDMKDDRTLSLFHILHLISESSSIKYILVENVRGFEDSATRNELVSCLENTGFNFKEFLLSPCQFGIPNSRQRYYLIGKRKDVPFLFTNDKTLTETISQEIKSILPKNKHEILAQKDNVINPVSEEKCYCLKHILEEDILDQYSIPLNILKKRWPILDIRHEDSNGSCCFTKAYSHYIEGTGSVFCPYSKEKMIEIFQEIKKLNDANEDSTKLFQDLKLRYFTPKEVSRLMCFPEEFSFPKEITNKQKYKLLGNSINVFVVSILIRLLCYKIEECVK